MFKRSLFCMINIKVHILYCMYQVSGRRNVDSRMESLFKYFLINLGLVKILRGLLDS